MISTEAVLRAPLMGRSVPLPLPLSGRLVSSLPVSDPATRAAYDALARDTLAQLSAALPVGRAGELTAYLDLVDGPADRSRLDVVRARLRGGPVTLRPGSDMMVFEQDLPVLGGGHPLARALARWAPASVRLEEVVVHAPPTEGIRAIAELIAARREEVAAVAELEAGLPPPLPPAPDPSGAPEPRFFDRFLALVGVHPTWNAPLDHPVVRSLERVLPHLPLPDGTTIAFARGGRPIRFERGRVVIDPQHPVVLALTQAGDVLTLAAAIVTEANRASADLTDAEEERALVSLLMET